MRKPLKYVGMIGSERKVKVILDHLRSLGFKEEAMEASTRP